MNARIAADSAVASLLRILVRHWAEVRIGKLLTRSLRRGNRRRAWFPSRISGEAPVAFARISPRTNPTEDCL
jgi:hypothetical protein